LEKRDWMVQLWQPLMNQILQEYRNYVSGKSECNLVLLITDHDFFSEFRKHFLEPAFGNKMNWKLVISGSYFKSHAKNMSEGIFFLSDMIGWITDKHADKAHRIRSLKELIEAARTNRKFLILCGYDYMLPRFYEYLKIAYFHVDVPRVKEMRLRSPSLLSSLGYSTKEIHDAVRGYHHKSLTEY